MTDKELRFIEWLEMSNQLKNLKSSELKLRKKLCIELFKNKTGVFKEKFETENISVTAESKVSIKLDEVVANQLFNELSDLEKRSLKTKLVLDKREYNKLPSSSLLHEAVTETPATPTLNVVVLKGTLALQIA